MSRSEREEPTGKAAQVIGAARDAFLVQGYDAVSMDEVAKRAGVAKQTVYSYYPSKDALFLAVVERERQSLDEILEAQPITTPAEALAGLRESGLQLLEFLLSPSLRSLLGAIVAATHRFPSLGTSIYEGVQRRQAQLASIIRKAVDANALKADDPRVAAEQFTALIRGELFLRCLFEPSYSPSRTEMLRQVDQAVDCFLAKHGMPLARPRPDRAKSRSKPSKGPS